MSDDTLGIPVEYLGELLAASGVGTWDWDLATDTIHHSDACLAVLGYTQADCIHHANITHPKDLPAVDKNMDAYLSGKSKIYQCEFRMRHRNGRYLWTRAVGKIIARNADGSPSRMAGNLLNIDRAKRSEQRLTHALEALEHNKLYLEREIERRTAETVEQDKLLWTVNHISKKLLSFQPDGDFERLVQDCLFLLGESLNKSRVYIWKDRTDVTGRVYCTQLYEWVRDAGPNQGNPEFEETLYDDLPHFEQAIGNDRCLNRLIRDLSDSERAILSTQGVKTILIAPVAINGRRWGFIGVDNCEDERLFTRMEENMLLMSGSMLANTIEKMETDADLREMEERTQIMLNATPLCCNLWTPTLQNMSCNDEAVRLFDLSSQMEYLARFNELSPPSQPCGRLSGELAAEYIAEAFQSGYCRFEWLHQKLDGTPIPAEITLVRIKYKDGFIVAGYTRDLREQAAMLSELQAKENDLRAARDEALLSTKAKSNFLANMSHEIRTPMNAISGLAELILRENVGETTAEQAKGIKAACSNLLNIINDILDISKIESGKLEIYSAQYELASLLHDVITISRMRLGAKPLMFITDIDSRLPAQMLGDEIRIKQILINILSNAIKFTQTGHIALRVTGVLEGECATLRFSVKDTGAGIKPEDLKRLFAEFERVNTTKNRSIEGTGLGLAISKQLCEMMGGEISVTSDYGIGSEFVVTIPQSCPEYEPLTQVREGKHVLLYEPRELYRHSIAETLENLGVTCTPCANQSDLYDNINAKPYDYILTAALHLKKVQSLAAKNELSTPVAAFADFGERVSDSKVYTILFPVNCLQISTLLNGHHQDEQFSRHDSDGGSFIAPSAHVLVVDDNLVNLQVAQGLMKPYQFSTDTASNGLEAVEMVKNTHYDLVFMDHMMPEMDGIDATIAIRQLEGRYYKTLPIIALTANALVGTREMFIREGMNDFLAKPIEINKLTHLLRRWLPQSKIIQSEAQPASVEAAAEPAWDIAEVNTAQGILSVGGSRENYLQILASYHTDGSQKCTTLLRHVTGGDIAAFRTEIHAVKSTSATIGALGLSTQAAALEDAAQRGDTLFIHDHLDDFLTAFQSVLESIRPLLPDNAAAEEQRLSGNPAYLKDALDRLSDAAELANISLMETVISALHSFSWPAETTQALMLVQQRLSIFDYDGVLDCVKQLKALQQ